MLADALGFHSVWAAEHRLWYDGFCPQLLHAQAFVAARTHPAAARPGDADRRPARPGCARAEAPRRSRPSPAAGSSSASASVTATPSSTRSVSDATVAAASSSPSSTPSRASARRLWLGGMTTPTLERAARRGAGLMLPAVAPPDRAGRAPRRVPRARRDGRDRHPPRRLGRAGSRARRAGEGAGRRALRRGGRRVVGAQGNRRLREPGPARAAARADPADGRDRHARRRWRRGCRPTSRQASSSTACASPTTSRAQDELHEQLERVAHQVAPLLAGRCRVRFLLECADATSLDDLVAAGEAAHREGLDGVLLVGNRGAARAARRWPPRSRPASRTSASRSRRRSATGIRSSSPRRPRSSTSRAAGARCSSSARRRPRGRLRRGARSPAALLRGRALPRPRGRSGTSRRTSSRTCTTPSGACG